MRTYDVTEAQVRLNECGEGQYVLRADAEYMLGKLELAYAAMRSMGHPDADTIAYALNEMTKP